MTADELHPFMTQVAQIISLGVASSWTVDAVTPASITGTLVIRDRAFTLTWRQSDSEYVRIRESTFLAKKTLLNDLARYAKCIHDMHVMEV